MVPSRTHSRRHAVANVYSHPRRQDTYEHPSTGKLCVLLSSWLTVGMPYTCAESQASGYLLLGMLSSLVFRAVRDALPDNPAAQERIIGASLLAMGIADVRTAPWFSVYSLANLVCS